MHVEALMVHWVSQFGVPHHLTSDQGAQFMYALWSVISSTLGVQLHHTSAYHPQSNGVVEHMHCNLKASLRACLRGPAWIEQLP